jgi:hypothetical protein
MTLPNDAREARPRAIQPRRYARYLGLKRTHEVVVQGEFPSQQLKAVLQPLKGFPGRRRRRRLDAVQLAKRPTEPLVVRLDLVDRVPEAPKRQ